MPYKKIRLTNISTGPTMGLVVPARVADERGLSHLLRLYDIKLPRLHWFQKSPAFEKWTEAFDYVFPELPKK